MLTRTCYIDDSFHNDKGLIFLLYFVAFIQDLIIYFWGYVIPFLTPFLVLHLLIRSFLRINLHYHHHLLDPCPDLFDRAMT